ncbi:hypothetical protein [Streptomyces indicus]|uniref:Tetratricopeptide repeat-containing protein n=1 Tax=Streptomyces indicus TaxID=417292 RepID=A0A1G9G6V5_9ACTN|nr:hypothetical protein [Streptomyces indicus]SDK96366.1 hypothetical protein SAMN05421806_11513 [Streptomyces indicus]
MLRGSLSPGEFAAAVRRAAREIGERVSCDARYVGRVEAGEIRCPNYAYERVFLHMFPGRTLTDMGFAPRETVRGRRARAAARTPVPHPEHPRGREDLQRVREDLPPLPRVPAARATRAGSPPPGATTSNRAGSPPPGATTSNRAGSPPPGATPYLPGATPYLKHPEESDVLRRVFMTGTTAAVASAAAPLSLAPPAAAAPSRRRVGVPEADAVEEAVRRIRLLDDRHGADGLYRRAAGPLRSAYALLDEGTARQSVLDRLQASAGELAISVGWLAHDSGRYEDARSHYGEALATARLLADPALEAHAFCNMSFLARDAGRPREAVRAAQAAQRAAGPLGSDRLLSLLALREAGGLAGLSDRAGCEQALARAQRLFGRGPSEADPEWMSFFGAAELAGLEAQCWSALGEWSRASSHARTAVALQDPHFTRNIALYTAELADDLARAGRPDEAAAAGSRVLDLLGEVGSTRVQAILRGTARVLLPHRRASGVARFLERHGGLGRTA